MELFIIFEEIFKHVSTRQIVLIENTIVKTHTADHATLNLLDFSFGRHLLIWWGLIIGMKVTKENKQINIVRLAIMQRRNIGHILSVVAALTTLSFVPSQAFAESGVTLWGIADESIRYLKGADGHNDALLEMANGAIYQSRWGMMGREDLGGGSYAVFNLLNGFSLGTGAPSSAGVVFNRYAYIGIGNDRYGLLKLGQQNNPAYELLFDGWDPLTVGNYLQNEWLPVALSGALRGEHNMTIYSFSRGTFNAQIGLSLGGVTGDFHSGAVRSLAIASNPAPLGAEIGLVQAFDGTDHPQYSMNTAIRYHGNNMQLWLGAYDSIDHTGAVDTFLTGTAVAPEAEARRDLALVAGASYVFSNRVTVTGAAYVDRARHISGEEIGRGMRYAYVALAEYKAAPKVSIYATIDYNRVSGAAIAELPNGRDQLGIATGLHYRF